MTTSFHAITRKDSWFACQSCKSSIKLANNSAHIYTFLKAFFNFLNCPSKFRQKTIKIGHKNIACYLNIYDHDHFGRNQNEIQQKKLSSSDFVELFIVFVINCTTACKCSLISIYFLNSQYVQIRKRPCSKKSAN